MSVSTLLTAGGLAAALVLVVAFWCRYKRPGTAIECDEVGSEATRFSIGHHLAVLPGRTLKALDLRPPISLMIALLALGALSLVAIGAGFSASDDRLGEIKVAGADGIPSFAISAKEGKSADDAYANLRAYAQKKVIQSPVPKRANLPDVQTMIARLAERLEKTPNDADGWRMLGWSQFHTKNYDAAAQAYARAVELSPDNAEWQAAHGEALVKAADGSISPQALEAFDRSLAIDKFNLRSRYYKGLAKKNSGDAEGALEFWTALMKETKGNEDWLPDLRRQAKTLAAQQGRNSRELLQSSDSVPAPSHVGRVEHAPSARDIANANQMSPSDRNAMIRNMVDGLAERLAKNPDDPNDWIKLMRSRMVLGEDEKAKAALTRAMKVFATNAKEKKKIVSAAKVLGIQQN